jgi:hypothetical protein
MSMCVRSIDIVNGHVNVCEEYYYSERDVNVC